MSALAILRLSGLRQLTRHRLRTALAILGMALGVILIVATGAINSSVVRSFEKTLVTLAGPAQLQVYGSGTGLPEGIAEVVRGVPGVEEATPLLLAHVSLPDYTGGQLALFGVDLLADQRILEAQFPRDRLRVDDMLEFVAQSGSVAVTDAFAERHGLALGATFRVQTPAGARTLTVRGFLAPTAAAALFGGDVGLMDIVTAQRLLGREGLVDFINVLPGPGAEQEVEQRLRDALAGRASIAPAGMRAGHVERMLGSVQVALTLASLVALVLALFLIHETMVVSLAQRQEEIALLSVAGFGRRALVTGLLLEAALQGGAAVAVGLPIGLAVAARSFDAVGIGLSTIVRIHVSDLGMTPLHVVTGIAVGLGVPVLAAALPVLRIVRIPPAAALRRARGEPLVGRPSRSLLAVGLGLAGVAMTALWLPVRPESPRLTLAIIAPAYIGFFVGVALSSPAFAYGLGRVLARLRSGRAGFVSALAARVLDRQFNAVGMTATAIAVGFATVISLAALMKSLDASVVRVAAAAMPSDLVVSRGSRIPSTPPLSEAVGRRIRDVEDVADVAAHRVVFAEYRGQPIVLMGFDAAPSARHGAQFTVTDGLADDVLPRLARGEGIIASDSFCRRFECRAGERLALDTPRGERVFPILAVVLDYTLDVGTLLLDRARYRELWGDPSVTSYEIWIRPGGDVHEARRRLQAQLEEFGVPVQTVGDLLATFRSEVDRSLGLAYGTEVVSGLVVALSVFSFFLTSTLDRRREIALLGAVGAGVPLLRRLLRVEAAICGAAGGVLGVLVGVLTSYTIVVASVPMVSGWRFDYAFPVGPVAAAVPFATLLAVIAATVPVRRVTKAPLAEALVVF